MAYWPVTRICWKSGKNKDKKDYVVKADSTLEREARDQVRKQIDRYISTRKEQETLDENFSTFEMPSPA